MWMPSLPCSLILLLMISLLGMNAAYVGHHKLSGEAIYGVYPVSRSVVSIFYRNVSFSHIHTIYEVCWWTHILLIFIFANILPYSKAFPCVHVCSQCFLSRLDPLGKLPNMDHVTQGSEADA